MREGESQMETMLWENKAHNDPRGKYDEEYLQYLRALLQSMREHGLVAYIVSMTPMRRLPNR